VLHFCIALRYRKFLQKTNLWFPRKTKMLESAWNLYFDSLNKELKYLKSQKTKKYIDKKTNAPIWKADQIAINKLQKYINDSKHAYDSWTENNTLTFRKICTNAYKNPLIKVFIYSLVLILFFVFIPFIVNQVVSLKPPFNINVAQDNDWIGFWSTYIAGTLGAFIGGFIAYLISIYQFKKQEQLSKEDRILSLVMENIPEIISDLNQLSYLINLDSSYVSTLIKLDSEYNSKKYDERFKTEAKKFLDLIHENKVNLFNQLECITTNVNSNRIMINHIVDYYKSINTEILELIASTKTIEDYYSSIIDNITESTNISNQSSEIIKTFESIRYKKNRAIYELYSIETELQNDLSFAIHGQRVLKKQSFSDYFGEAES